MTHDADQMKRRRAELRARVKHDLGARGLTSADLEGLQLDTDWDEGHVTGWTMRVALTGDRPALAYSRANRDEAPVIGPEGVELLPIEVQ